MNGFMPVIRGASPGSGVANHDAGFTLIELLMVLTVAAVLLTLAGPGFSRLIQDNRLTVTSNAIAGTLNAARSEAIAQRKIVTVCSSANGSDCGGNWGNGWISFLDENGDATRDAGDEILRHHASLPPSVSVSLSGATDIRFTSQGFVLPGSSGTLLVCDARGSLHARALIVSNTGRVSVATDSDADGIVNDADGDNIECP